MQAQSNINPFHFACSQCGGQCQPLHIVVTVTASYFRQRKHFCSVQCAQAWLGPG